MKHVQNSYDNRGGYGGNLLLTIFFAALAIFCLGGGAFSDGDVRYALLVLSIFAGFISAVCAGMWSNARTRFIEETVGGAG